MRIPPVAVLIIISSSNAFLSQRQFTIPHHSHAHTYSNAHSNSIGHIHIHKHGSGSGSVLYNTPTEKILRKELEDKNSAVQNEEKYSVMDGADMEGAFTDLVGSTSTSGSGSLQTRYDSSSLAAKIDRMTKPRAYPLFLAEKAAEFLESTFLKSNSQTLTASRRGAGTKEKIVVLGTGWGAASFVKEIDTDQYDVTVISPRNYFLFTPMLAGASVGTVEFRSITEPIREVSEEISMHIILLELL